MRLAKDAMKITPRGTARDNHCS